MATFDEAITFALLESLGGFPIDLGLASSQDRKLKVKAEERILVVDEDDRSFKIYKL